MLGSNYKIMANFDNVSKEHSGSVDDMGKVKHPVEREGLYSSHQIHPTNTAVDMKGS